MIAVVVPVYNEEALVTQLYTRLASALQKTAQPWRLYFVNDGSSDSTLDQLLELHRRHPEQVHVVELSRNWGHQPALSAGLAVAEGDAVVLIDGDLQDPPELIPELVQAWQQGSEVVIATRRKRAETGWRSWVFPLFYRTLGMLSDFPIPLNAGIFGLLDRRAVDSLNALGERNRYLPGLRAWIGFRSTIVAYERDERAAGEPKQTLVKLVRYALDAIFSFSYKPIRLSLVLGLIVAVFALLWGLVCLYCRLLDIGLFGMPVVPGYTSLIVSILFLAGVQLIMIGVLGEYIGRIYDEVKRRPLFLIRRFHNGEQPPI